MKGWSQEDMAEKLDMSVNGYAKIEHGDTDVQLSRLEQIAKIFEMDLLELLKFGEKNIFCLAGDNNSLQFQFINWQQTIFSGEQKELQHQLEKTLLKVESQEKEIVYLKKIISLMEKGGGQ